MADDTLYTIKGSTLTSIANAIRTKDGTVTGTIKPEEMADDIINIPTEERPSAYATRKLIYGTVQHELSEWVDEETEESFTAIGIGECSRTSTSINIPHICICDTLDSPQSNANMIMYHVNRHASVTFDNASITKIYDLYSNQFCPITFKSSSVKVTWPNTNYPISSVIYHIIGYARDWSSEDDNRRYGDSEEGYMRCDEKLVYSENSVTKAFKKGESLTFSFKSSDRAVSGTIGIIIELIPSGDGLDKLSWNNLIDDLTIEAA